VTIFFTADTHFGHRNIIKHCNRPFVSVDDMRETLIANWNSRVGQNDWVYHLGDFAWRTQDGDVLDRLNGRKFLVLGNHDSARVEEARSGWLYVAPYMELSSGTVRKIVLCHYKLQVWNQMRRGAVHLYGHSHGNLPGCRQSLDVGVDNVGFFPITIDEALERMTHHAESPELLG
jgi:calcineurin-like phosphoesterase family protein